MLFLVFVGGLLVMFAYVAVLAPNTFFLNSKPMLWMFLIFLLGLLLLQYFFPVILQALSTPLQVSSSSESKSTGSDLIFMNSTSIMIIPGIVLLIALLAVVKICNYQQDPLRTHSHTSILNMCMDLSEKPIQHSK